jgi:benzoyl-CoA reductase/2-hydroxyglutaryl-CoA dehydratase subunit BcrC/BadD/HgdB
MDGLAIAQKYYDDYGMRARQLKAKEGDKLLGYLSVLTPLEIISAAGVVPVRLRGNVSEAIAEGDARTDAIVCPSTRNVFDADLKGNSDFLDGMVIPSHQCDSIDQANNVWRHKLKLPYWHFLNIPDVTDKPPIASAREILRVFMISVEELVGHKITDVALSYAITGHWFNRRIMRRLYELRKTETPLISGTELTKVLVAAMSIPVHESSALIESVIAQVEQRPAPRVAPRKRIMLIGYQIDDFRIPQAIEEAGAWVVMDDISIGHKLYWNDLDRSEDMLCRMAKRYLRQLGIPTIFESSRNTYQENLESRYAHIRRHIQEFKVDGVILFVHKYCDPCSQGAPAIKSYVESLGIPVLCMDGKSSMSSLGQLVEARIKTFVEGCKARDQARGRIRKPRSIET